ncbi:MAG: hypothetical protein M1821_000147 [Bathelium mastoideum]|nr:MAG: hypothetical protein M1821_000147 [Bathelium mastoideum]KAI9687821.1 MAG: hypothetical protein M1822_001901 [Bathelium mastoideum]
MKTQSLVSIFFSLSTTVALPAPDSASLLPRAPVYQNFFVNVADPSSPFWQVAGSPCQNEHVAVTGTWNAGLASRIQADDFSASCLNEKDKGIQIYGLYAQYFAGEGTTTDGVKKCKGQVKFGADGGAYADCVAKKAKTKCADGTEFEQFLQCTLAGTAGT